MNSSQMWSVLGAFVLAALLLALLVQVSSSMGGQSTQAVRTMQTALQSARTQASANGATVTLAASATGSVLTVTDGAGNVTTTQLGANVTIATQTSATITVLPDGMATCTLGGPTLAVAIGGTSATLDLQPLGMTVP